MENKQPTPGYKKNVWWYVVAYIIVGGLIYWAIYAYYTGRNGGYSAPMTNTSQPTSSVY